MKIKQICSIGLAAAAICMAGCATTPETEVRTRVAYKEVNFPAYPIFNELPPQAERTGDLMEIVKLGIALGDTGHHDKAAEVFLQGAKDFQSEGKRLEQAFISAAIMEHFKAGMIAQVREDFKKLDALRTNPYSKYDDNKDIEKIRAIVKAK